MRLCPVINQNRTVCIILCQPLQNKSFTWNPWNPSLDDWCEHTWNVKQFEWTKFTQCIEQIMNCESRHIFCKATEKTRLTYNENEHIYWLIRSQKYKHIIRLKHQSAQHSRHIGTTIPNINKILLVFATEWQRKDDQTTNGMVKFDENIGMQNRILLRFSSLCAQLLSLWIDIIVIDWVLEWWTWFFLSKLFSDWSVQTWKCGISVKL